jgi:hypothetical protein
MGSGRHEIIGERLPRRKYGVPCRDGGAFFAVGGQRIPFFFPFRQAGFQAFPDVQAAKPVLNS